VEEQRGAASVGNFVLWPFGTEKNQFAPCVSQNGPGKVTRSPEIERVMLFIFYFFACYLM
jgi:hypothetical protein